MRKLVIYRLVSTFAVVFLSSCAVPVATQSLPVTIQLPSGCEMVRESPVQSRCDYTAENARHRAIVLDFYEVVLDEIALEELVSMDAEALELILNNQIKEIDIFREAARPPGDYSKLKYGHLNARDRPIGFQSCTKSQDEFTSEGSDFRSDRTHLHCWGADASKGILYYLLLSLVEYNEVKSAATSTLGDEFDNILASISLN
jgi:hypothetical protein